MDIIYLNLECIFQNYNITTHTNELKQKMNIHNPKYKTLFADEPLPQQPNANHPLFYYNNRNQFLSSLSDKYSSKYRLPTMDLRRNVRVDYYLNKYQQTKQKIEKQQKFNNCYLDSNQFNTVFSDCIDQRRQKNRERLAQQRLRQDLNNLYIAQQQIYEQPEHDNPDNQTPTYKPNNNKKVPKNVQNQKQNDTKFNTILIDYRQDPIKQKQLYLLDYQIGKLKLEQRIQKQVKQNRQMCRDQSLLTKMSNNILSAYMVHFDQIYNQLIDQMLTQQVYYLNYLQAQYAVEKSEWEGPNPDYQKIRYENEKTIQMMDLVKKLDQLCDQ